MSSTQDLDIISITGASIEGKCGYCKNISNNKSSFGIICNKMKPETYLQLMNRGWRRCGTYFYKPLNETTCCPLYTIRCDTINFQLSKSQKRILKNFRKFLCFGKESVKQKSTKSVVNARGDEVSKNVETKSRIKLTQTAKCGNIRDKSKKAKTIRYNLKLANLKLQANLTNKSYEELFTQYKSRRAQRLEKTKPLSLGQLLDFSTISGTTPKHELQVKTVRCHPESERFSASKQSEHGLYSKYQVSVHQDSPNDVDMNQFSRFLVNGGLHSGRSPDEIDVSKPRRGEPPLGQYHQQYWLDGRLIAVGVIDLVPGALSSVYLFYDPEFAFLELGTFSALFEIDFVRRLGRAWPFSEFRYYYMGFYTHHCVKMRYKAQFESSSLLCPLALSWVPVERCQKILDVPGVKFARFSDPPATAKQSRDELEQLSIDQLGTLVNVVVGGQQFKLKRFIGQLRQQFRALFEQFAKLVGRSLLPSLRVEL